MRASARPRISSRTYRPVYPLGEPQTPRSRVPCLTWLVSALTSCPRTLVSVLVCLPASRLSPSQRPPPRRSQMALEEELGPQLGHQEVSLSLLPPSRSCRQVRVRRSLQHIPCLKSSSLPRKVLERQLHLASASFLLCLRRQPQARAPDQAMVLARPLQQQQPQPLLPATPQLARAPLPRPSPAPPPDKVSALALQQVCLPLSRLCSKV